ncbi:hypothetical protein [Streptomyces sp. NPDC047869]|uniref:hypothetical protein n=1 Tax=Streptomyces sp. NPDC047869 TaxID=3154709 RepID=UPI003454E1B8
MLPLVLLAGAVTGSASATASAGHPARAAFGLDAVSYPDAAGAGPRSALASDLRGSSFSVKTAPSGETAVVDRSLAEEGALSAANSSFVDLAWKSYSSNARYTIVRDETTVAEVPAGVASFRDTSVTAGSHHQYRIIPQLVGKDTSKAHTFGLQVRVPEKTEGGSALAALRKSASERAISMKAAKQTTLTWETFIHNKYLSAPTMLGKAICTYGKGYYFRGDNHGFDWKASGYRTAANAVITWEGKKVKGYTAIGTTHVYKKQGAKYKFVAKRTASGSKMQVKKLGSAWATVDIRMVTHATNPFCSKKLPNAIDGGLTFKIVSNGNWEIRQGNHRLMPDHLIYIYNGGNVTTVYKRKAASPWCLSGDLILGCQLANLTGYSGHYK